MIKTYLTKIFSVALLMMVSMGAWADVKIFYGEKGEELKNGETKIKADNGTIAIEQKASSDGSQTTVNLTFTPNSGYTISTDNIEVYAVISPNSGSTRAPEISGDPLKLSEESSKDPEKRYSVKVDSKLGLWIKKASFLSGSKNNRNTTYTYYALHCNNKGYLKQYKGIVGNDGTFRYENAYDDNGSSMWVYSSDGYLQQEMYYLNVLNGQTLVLSTTPETKWDLVDDNEKKRFQLNGSTKILGLDASNKVTLAESPTNKYAVCTLTVTENNSKWDGPKDVSWTVQSPQLVTYLRTYYLRNITVNIDKNDAGTENVKVVDKKDSRCYCTLTYKSTSNTDKGTTWDINTTTGIVYVYNNTTSSVKNVAATYEVAPLNPIVLADHAASDQTITLTINAKALSPDGSKKYLLFNTQDGNYRFPKASSSISEGDLLPVDGKQSDLTEAVNGDISYEIEVDDEGFYSFKNITTGRYFYYDAADFTVSNYGAVKIGSTSPGSDTRYKFRLYSAGKRDPFESCLYIIPYDKQFAVWKSDGVLGELYFALYMNTSGNTKIASIYKASDNAKWKIYAYEWEYRLWDNWSISGDQSLYATGNHFYTASTWFSRNIKGSPTNAEHLMLPNSKTHDGITYTWNLTGLSDYISTSDVLASGTSTLTATVNSLPPSTRSGTLTAQASISSPASKNNSKTITVTLNNLNPTFTEVSSLSQITDASGLYKLTTDNTYSDSNKPSVTTFSGTLDGGSFTISGLSAPLFQTLDGGTVRNVNFDNVNISSGNDKGDAGTVCSEARGSSRIYNVGVLATGSTVTTDNDGYTKISSCSSTVSGSRYVGGLVGLLDGEARVINCFSYADIKGGTDKGGIVGYNNYATNKNDLRTMVMNCMFYGDIVSGGNIAPIYAGNNISNKDNTGVGNFNYFRAEAPYAANQLVNVNNGNSALMAETRFLQRFEFFRHLLNGHRELAAWWATGDVTNKDKMLKWVMEPSQIGSTMPYPVLKAQGYYPSVVNLDADNASTTSERNKGGKLGTLNVTIEMGDGEQFEKPEGATITTPSLILNITDKDPEHFNFNYYKVQLPYYNDVGTKNYTGNRVVVGWMITSITGGTAGTFSVPANDNTPADAPYYNYADRNCTDKDLYSVSGRIFNQGDYWDVPEGVTDITIKPYWAKAAYVADDYRDVVYNQGMSTKYNVETVGGGQWFQNNKDVTFTFKGYPLTLRVYNAISNAITALSVNTAYTVYDYAIVLVGNYHQYNGIKNGSSGNNQPYTLMSIDLDEDNEPDYSYILRFDSRTFLHPMRVDFLSVPGLGMAQKSTGGTGSYNFGIPKPRGWFEVTNTALFRVTQFEYSPNDRVKKPIILHGGVIEQWVSSQGGNGNDAGDRTSYFYVGDNVWFKEFHIGVHQDYQNPTPHPPVSVTGGDYDEFYLTGLYQAAATNYNDNAECYINGGRFGIVAGAGMEGIGHATNHTNGNITWQIDHADMDEFYGGGINAAKPLQGNISTTISNSHVGTFCGGPKFGDMESNRTVTTNATNCTFGTYFGAGYGGTSYSRYAPKNKSDVQNVDWNAWVRSEYKQDYNSTYQGVSTQINYQFIPMSGNASNVARLWVEFAKFSLATTHGVTSNLTGCTVTGNFYGGGSLGKVDGNVTSTLNNCTVNGSAFGAGYSASLPTVEVDSIGFRVEPLYYSDFGTYRTAVKGETTTYEWKHANSVNPDATAIDKDNHILYTTEDLTTLGTVTGKATLNIEGTTTVDGSVYGGGEESAVGGDTEVHVTGGTIGYANAPEYGAIVGNVYGGGKGLADNVTAGLVKGNTKVTIEGNTESPLIYHNIYGGGAFGSVGTYTYKSDGSIETYTEGGKCEVYVKGGQVGIDGHNNGMIFGSSRGDVSTPVGTPAIDPNDYLAWVHDTKVVIGDETKGTEQSGEGNSYDYPVIKGSVYGGGENGHTYQNTVVDIHSGMIGIVEIGLPDSERYTSRGNIYGGGCGTDTYDVSGKTYYNLNAGIVLGTTTVNIDGGHIARNVYGAGSMGSVGTFTLDDDNTNNILDGKPVESADGTGVCNVNISGGMIGNPGAKMHYDDSQTGPDDFGHVFGAGRGETRDSTDYVNLNIVGYVNETHVTISNKAFITGSVYGGGECGHTLGDTFVTVSGGQIGSADGENGPYEDSDFTNAFNAETGEVTTSLNVCSHWPYQKTNSPYDIYAGDSGYNQEAARGGSKKATDGHTFNGNVFGGGSGYYPYAPGKWVRSAGLVEGNTNVLIQGGHILSSVYGGNEHTDVYGKCTVVMKGGTIGVPMTYADKLAYPITGNLFGAGKGDKRVLFNTWTNVKETSVTIEGGRIYGSVFGGGEDGHVLGDTETTIKETDATNHPTIIGTLGTTGYDGNVFGGGRGSYTALTAGVVCGNVKLNIEGGKMFGSVYGGGRLASVGTHLVPPTTAGDNPSTHPYYGKQISDGKKQQIWKYADNDATNDEDEDAEDGQTHGHVTINIKGGTIGAFGSDGKLKNSLYTGNVFGGCKGTTNGEYTTSNVTYNPITGDTEAQAILGISKSAIVNVLGGTVGRAVYGGGEVGNVGERGADDSADKAFAKVNLLGGTVANAYGGGLGMKKGVNGATENVETLVKGNVKVNLNGLETDDYDATLHDTYVTGLDENGVEGVDFYRVANDAGCIVSGIIFGCNNLNGTPLGHAKVHVFKTHSNDANTYDVAAIYGGGNQADYVPDDSETQQKTEVIIEGCNLTSIQQVYGGGNAAAVPGTLVLIKGTKIIDEVFGGGNGVSTDTFENPGANVGYRTGTTTAYGGDQGGKSLVQLMAGTIHNAYGGSNSNGDIRGGSNVTTVKNEWKTGDGQNAPCCKDLLVDQMFGGGKNANMKSGANIVLGCSNSNAWVKEIYAGAENANVGGNVSLTLTSGKYGRVFGGNKTSGMLDGSITVNIEENGQCGIPLIIGELYGGGNKAAYSIFGYEADGKVKTSGDNPHASPVVNVRAFTSIGNIFGGGYGAEAEMYGSPTVNINETLNHKDDATNYSGNAYAGETLNFVNDQLVTDALPEGATPYTVVLPAHADGKIGAIGNVYGGGNAAKVNGNTNVNIGTTATEPKVKLDNSGNPLYTDAEKKNLDKEDFPVVGADIRGNVYGGGNEAEVTGNTNVNIGKKVE